MNLAPGMLSVAELNRAVRQLLEQNFPLLWVAGEISNLTRAASGHWYFSLKDDQASVRCVMFRQKNQLLDWIPKEGMQVEARALVTLYEARGDFQLGIEYLRRSGVGAAYEAFLRLKEKLTAEGLFDAERKKPIPPFPARIGVVTSPKAAALRDILTTLSRRMPSIDVVVYPTLVQGEGAPENIAAAIALAARRRECEVLIVARGGGSIEDIWAFNSEIVARAISACPIPIISGVGHETDFTIADFAADRRAPTPTAAAEIASPDRDELLHRLGILGGRMIRANSRILQTGMLHLDHLSRRLIHPAAAIENQLAHCRHLWQRLQGAVLRPIDSNSWRLSNLSHRLASCRPDPASQLATLMQLRQRLDAAIRRKIGDDSAGLARIAAHLDHLNPQAVLERGYSIVEDSAGTVLRSSDAVAIGEELKITLAHGALRAGVVAKS